MKYLLDADIVTAILKKEEKVGRKLSEKLSDNHKVIISHVTYYEIKRGLRYRDAKNQLSFFVKLCSQFDQIPINQNVIEIAVENWVFRRKNGFPYNDDADILLAATALQEGAILVTRNTKHFHDPKLCVEPWN